MEGESEEEAMLVILLLPQHGGVQCSRTTRSVLLTERVDTRQASFSMRREFKLHWKNERRMAMLRGESSERSRAFFLIRGVCESGRLFSPEKIFPEKI